jgi:hypothetical protein
VWHDRTLEAVGSTPIGSTNFSRGWTPFDPLKPFQNFPLSAFLCESFQLLVLIEVTVVGSCFCFAR